MIEELKKQRALLQVQAQKFIESFKRAEQLYHQTLGRIAQIDEVLKMQEKHKEEKPVEKPVELPKS